LVLASSAVASAANVVMNRKLERGQTCTATLLSMGVQPEVARRIIDALDDVVDLRRLRAGQQLRVVWSDDAVKYVDYRVDTTVEYQVWRDGPRYVAARRQITLDTQLSRFDFNVESTLWKAAMQKRASPSLAMALSDAFGWELDVMREARTGDKAKLLVEELTCHGRLVRYGEVLGARYEKVSGRRLEVFRYELPNGSSGMYLRDGRSAQRRFMKSPAGWAPLTSGFGWRLHPVTHEEEEFHDGVDYAMPVGTPVRTVGPGLVTFAGYTHGGGNTVCVAHEDNYESCYLHLSRIFDTVRTDAPVAERQVLGLSGNTGNTTAPHLHFSLKRFGRYVNPIIQRFARTESVPADLRDDFQQVVADRSAALDAPPVTLDLK
jgi:murein DD-endopeptidase MepM/ murein hydrolase activator NlpD